MDIAAQYAQALFESEKPTLAGLRATLKHRGQERLMPRIFAEYKKLLLKEERLKKYAAVTPEGERARILLELYHTLIATR